MKSLGKILKWVLVLVLLLTGLFFLGRNSLLKKILDSKLNQFQKSKAVQISYSDVHFTGIASVELQNLSVVPKLGDTLVYLGKVNVEIKLSSLLMGRINLRSLKLESLHLRPKDIFGYKNFQFLLTKDSSNQVVSKADSKGYAALADRLLTTLFDLLPTSYSIKDFRISGIKNLICTQIIIDEVTSDAGEYNFWAGVYESGKKSYWHFIGTNDKSNRQLSGSLIRAEKQGNFPVLLPLLGFRLSADTLDFDFKDEGLSGGELKLRARLRCSNWEMEHWRISPKPVSIPNCGGKIDLNIGKDYVTIESTSHFFLGKVQALTYFNFNKQDSRKVALKIVMPESPSQDFFNSLPNGLFANLEGIQTQGDLAFHLDFALDLDNPDQVEFDAGLDKKGFKLIQMGAENLSKMNGEFLYTAYENGVPAKTFAVGTSNPSFVPLDKISPYLQQSILSSEDGSFFGHLGFNMDAFKSSITANAKAKRFVRGASTISMQLVKNVFLTRNKTMARKLEEILMVWLIENLRLSSKERMYEVYLNVIEWGPGIYGIGEASDFYFKKTPENLTLNESIFLASIIPSPKWFKYRFDEQGHLRQDMESYFRVISGHLLKRGVITEEVKNELLPGVELTGRAKEFLHKTDTIVPDSNVLDMPVLPLEELQ
jgi:hypothetical protein